MCSNVNARQLRTICHSCRSIYVDLVATTNLQKKEKKEPKQNMKKKKREEMKNREKLQNNQNTMNGVAITMHLPVTTSNVNGVDTPVRRLRVAEWTEEKDPLTFCLRDPSSEQKIQRMKGCKKSHGYRSAGGAHTHQMEQTLKQRL